MSKKVVLLFVTLLIFSVALYVTMIGPNRVASLVVKDEIMGIINAAVDNEPFKELTIEYLRTRNYGDGTIEIVSSYQDQPRYTSHIATYDSEGLKISGLLAKPKGEVPEGGFPAIVFVHGFVQPDLYVTTQKYVDYIDALARSGFVVYKIDLRGHGDSEGEATGAYFSSDYVIDALNAYESLKSLDFVNDQEVGFWGHSMAGNIVLRSLAVKPEIPAAVIWAGAVYSYTDFAEYGLNDKSFVRERATSSRILQRSRDLFGAVGEIDSENEFWKKVAPTSFVGDLDGSIQLHHAVNDPVVSVEYSRELKKKLIEAGVSSESFEYLSSDHNIGSPHFTQAMQRTVEFFNQNLN